MLFNFGSDQDFKDSTKVIGAAYQGGLSLPDRDYYTRDDDESKKLRQQFVEHVTKMLVLAGDSQEKAAGEANTVLSIETSFAKASMTNVERRDPAKIYHKMSVTDAQALTPHLSWDAYFQAVGNPKLTEINIGQPDFFKALDGMLTSVSLADWKTYYRWQLIHRSAALLSDPFVQEDFAFDGFARAGSVAAALPIRSWGKLWARSTCRSIFRQRPKPAHSNWCTTCLRPSATICKPCHG